MSSATKPQLQQNHFLAAFSPEIQQRLFPHLEAVPLPLRSLLYEPESPMQHIYFPADCIISLQYVLDDGSSSAIAAVGNEGLLGINLFLSGPGANCRYLVQSPGHAYRLPKQLLQEEFDRHGQVMLCLFCYAQTLFAQASQSAICNRHHSIDAQLCRWLLLSMDRAPGGLLTMTHEFISDMLGVRRESVTQAASKLQHQGVITYSRGLIKVLDRPKLESLSCECYAKVKQEEGLFLDYLQQRTVL